MLLVAATRANSGPNFLSLSRMRYLGVCPYGVASRSCCATQESVGDRVTCTWMILRDFRSMMNKAKSGRAEEIGDLQEIASPDHGSHDCAERSSRSVHEREMARICFIYFWIVRLLT